MGADKNDKVVTLTAEHIPVICSKHGDVADVRMFIMVLNVVIGQYCLYCYNEFLAENIENLVAKGDPNGR